MKRIGVYLAPFFLLIAFCLGMAALQLKEKETIKEPTGAYALTLPIITYHAIRTIHNAPLSGTVIDYDRFAEEMRYLHEQGYTSLNMDEVVQFMRGRKLPPKIVAINFDDGLISSLQAVPLLLRYGFKATFWVIPGVAQPNPLKPGADRLYMSWLTLELLDKVPGMALYSHTMTHPWQAGDTLVDWAQGLTPGKTVQDVNFELTESKKQLEDKLGHPVSYLDWPSGIYNQELIDLAQRAGYKAIVTTDDTFNKPGGDVLRLHRTMINGNCDLKTFEMILADGKYRACES